MGDLTMEVRTRDGQSEFAPGDRVGGEVIVHATDQWEAELLELVLFWRTEGKGNTDTGVVASESLCSKGETISPGFSRNYSLKLPLMPQTYHGRILKIHWYIGLYAKAKGEAEQYYERSIVVRPRQETAPIEPPDMPPDLHHAAWPRT